MARTQRDLARTFSTTEATVSRWLKRSDWPVRRRGPWSEQDIETIEQWRLLLQDDRSGKSRSPVSPDAKHRADTLLKVHRARKVKAEADMAEGRVVDRDLLELGIVAVARGLVQTGDDVFHRLEHRIAADDPKIATELQQSWREFRERLLDMTEVELTRIDDEIHDRLIRRRRGRGRRSVS